MFSFLTLQSLTEPHALLPRSFDFAQDDESKGYRRIKWNLARPSRKEILRGLSLTLAAQDDSGVKSSQESSKPCLSFHHKNLNTQKPNGLNPFG